METIFQHMADQRTTEAKVAWPRDEVIKEAKRIEESTLLSSKGHFAVAVRWGYCHLILGSGIAVLSAIAAAFTFSSFSPISVGVLALIITVLSAVVTFLNPNERATKHLNAGNGYDSVCNRARIFWTIECWAVDADPQALTDKVKQLSAEKSKLNLESPQIAPWAYRSAKKGVASGEGVYAVDQPQASAESKSAH